MFFLLSILFGSIFALLFFWVDCNPYLYIYYLFGINRNYLNKKVVWIVGASTGIGEEMAYQLAKKNCKLILTSTSKNKLDQVKENCLKVAKDLRDDDILVIAYDITDLKESENAFSQIVQKFGDIDVLINNAGKMSSSRIVEDFDLELHRSLFDVNYFSSLKIAKIVTKFWLESKSKGLKIISATSSIAAYSDSPFFAAYSNSKRALNGFYKDLALQHYKDGISVVILVPGPTQTALLDNAVKVDDTKLSVDSVRVMSAKRFVNLALVAIRNKHSESWICQQPMLLLTYLTEKFSYEFLWIYKVTNAIKIFEKQFVKEQAK